MVVRNNTVGRFGETFRPTLVRTTPVTVDSLSVSNSGSSRTLFGPRPAAFVLGQKPTGVGEAEDKTTEQSTLQLLLETVGYRSLDSETQTFIRRLIEGSHFLAQPADKGLRDVLDNESFRKASAEEQARGLKSFLTHTDDWQPYTAPDLRTALPNQNLRIKTGEPKEIPRYRFESGWRGEHQADALRYVVEFNDHPVEIFVFKYSQDPGYLGTYRSIDQVTRTLASLPMDALRLVKKIEVVPMQAQSNAAMAAGKSTIEIYPDFADEKSMELNRIMLHETGHLFDDAHGLADTRDISRSALWQEAMASDRLSPSGYAKVSSMEDFAEFFVLYQSVKGTPLESELRYFFGHRFQVMDNILKKH